MDQNIFWPKYWPLTKIFTEKAIFWPKCTIIQNVPWPKFFAKEMFPGSNYSVTKKALWPNILLKNLFIRHVFLDKTSVHKMFLTKIVSDYFYHQNVPWPKLFAKEMFSDETILLIKYFATKFFLDQNFLWLNNSVIKIKYYDRCDQKLQKEKRLLDFLIEIKYQISHAINS